MAKNRPAPSPKAIAFGARIASARIKSGYSQETLGNMLGVTKGAVGQYEIGYTTPRSRKIHELARILGVTVNWLLTGDEPDEQVKAQTQTELAALHLIRAIPPDKHEALLAMMQGLAGSITKS